VTLPLFLIATGIAMFFYLLGFSAGQKSKNDIQWRDTHAT